MGLTYRTSGRTNIWQLLVKGFGMGEAEYKYPPVAQLLAPDTAHGLLCESLSKIFPGYPAPTCYLITFISTLSFSPGYSQGKLRSCPRVEFQHNDLGAQPPSRRDTSRHGVSGKRSEQQIRQLGWQSVSRKHVYGWKYKLWKCVLFHSPFARLV